MIRILVGLICLLYTSLIQAKIVLPYVITDNMVLQQKSEAPIWGKTDSKTKVIVKTSWDNKEYKQMPEPGGSWKIYVKTPKAGGPYKISISDGEKVELKNILIGEVWLCSGQSNMEMPLKGFNKQPVLNAKAIIAASKNEQIRLFKVSKATSAFPKNDLEQSSWQISDSASASEFSAVAFQFGKMLQEKLKVPVGLIVSAYGGTAIEAWMDKASISLFPNRKVPTIAKTKLSANDATVLYNAMIHPLAGYNISGVLWYQGEQNRFHPQDYDKRMAAMVAGWRKVWNQDEWPFYYVQIAPYDYNKRDSISHPALLREAQYRALKLIPNSEMVVTMDLGSEDSIHPPDKTMVSSRLANIALATTYGQKGIHYISPAYKSRKINGRSIILFFDNAPNGLIATDNVSKAFEIAGDDKIFYPAKAKINGNTVVVESSEVLNPIAVRYAFKGWITGDIFSKEGLPAVPFRTDCW